MNTDPLKIAVALLATAACGLITSAGVPAATEPEWTLERAKEEWKSKPLVKPVEHVGVPGYQYQAGVLWDGSLYFGPLNGFDPELLGNSRMHLAIACGDKMRFVDRRGTNSPDIKRWLESGRLPVPHVQTKDGDLIWHETVFAHLLDRNLEDGMTPKPDDTLVVHIRFQVKNTGVEPRTAHAWLYASSIDQVSLGYSCEVRPELGKAIEHKWEPPYDVVDGKVRYVIPPPAKGTVRWNDAIAAPEGATGPAGNVIEWEVPLGPGEEAELRLVVPYGLVDRGTGERLLRLDSQKLLRDVVAFWEHVESGPGQITTPEPFVNDYVAAVVGQMAQQVAYRPKQKHWMYKTSPNWYEQYWPCNAAKALPAFDFRGLTQYSVPALQSFVDFQTDDAPGLGVASGEGFAKVQGFLGVFPGWTANTLPLSHGTGMAALALHFRITRDRKWLGEGPGSPLQAMLDACDWVATQRRRTMREENGAKVAHWGLLPAAAAHDWLAGNTIFNDGWCIYGMTEVVRLLREIDHPRAEELAKELAAYRQCLRERYVEARAKAKPLPMPDGTTIPYVPRTVQELDWSKPDWTITGYGPLRAGAMGALDPNDELVDQALAFLEAGRPVKDDPNQREHLWSHYVEVETMWPVGCHIFLARDDLPRYFEWLFNNLVAAIHADWKVGMEARDGVPSCAPGDGERWQAIRKMFVNERGGYDGSEQSLFLLQAIPRCWLKPGDRMAVKDMPTCFGGKINLTVVVSADGASVNVEARLAKLAVQPVAIRMRLRSGDGRPLASAGIDGASVPVREGDTIELPVARDGTYRIVGRFR